MNNPRYSHKGNDCDTYTGERDMSVMNKTHLALHSLCTQSPLRILLRPNLYSITTSIDKCQPKSKISKYFLVLRV